MLTSIRSRIRASILYSLVFASIALLSACGGGYSGGNNNGGGFAGRAGHSEYSASGRNRQFTLLIHLHGLERGPGALHLVRNRGPSPRPDAYLRRHTFRHAHCLRLISHQRKGDGLRLPNRDEGRHHPN